MAFSNTPRPAYVYDTATNEWIPVGVGGHSHPDYITQATAVNPTLIDAKGDIITATAADTPARLAVGNNGETLVADSSTSTGLSYQANWAAGKNKIINGNFGIWQRGTSFTVTGTESDVYKADRWCIQADGSTTTRTISQQTFTAGTAPVAGYEGTYFFRFAQTTAGNNTYNYVIQKIEDVRTFAGQTVTLSFWAKADSNRTVVTGINQFFGSGGSSTVAGTTQNNSVTTSWTRFTHTISVASISGKTIGTGSSANVVFTLPNGGTPTIDIWGVQVEAGSVATAFQTATGTIQGELAACQRYYYRVTTPTSNYGAMGLWGIQSTTTTGVMIGKNPVTMRVEPTSIEYSSLAVSDSSGTESITALTINSDRTNADMISCDSTNSGALTQYRYSYIRANNSSSAYFGVSAEL